MSQSNDSGLNLDHLEACPFCGELGVEMTSRGYAAFVFCPKCQAEGPADDTAAAARDAWNSRAALANQPAPLVLLETEPSAVDRVKELIGNQPAPTVPAGDGLPGLHERLAQLIFDNTALDWKRATSLAIGAVVIMESDPAHQPAQEQAEPVAWAVFAENGNVRIWFGDKAAAERWVEANEFDSDKMVALYAGAAPAQAAQQEPVAAPQQVAAPGAQLVIGVVAPQGATISILQPHADGTTTVIYGGTHPAGDSMGRAVVAAAPSAPGTPEAPKGGVA